MTIYNVYCDESCHLLNDRNDIMVLGCISCEAKYIKGVHEDIRKIKKEHKISNDFEIKWTKVSQGKADFYINLIDYFFNSNLNFRAVIATGKNQLVHEEFNQTHDDWYYKMYYLLLREVIDIQNYYRLFLDIKDTKSSKKIIKLKDVLNRSLYSFVDEVVQNIQVVKSEEVGLIQLTDLLTGAISYWNRGIEASKAKISIVQKIQEHTGLDLKTSTNKNAIKFNLFVWHPRRYIYGK